MVSFNDDDLRLPRPRKFHFHKRTRYTVGKAVRKPTFAELLFAHVMTRLDRERDKKAAIARGEMLAFRGKGGR